jgi:hypothetical protein
VQLSTRRATNGRACRRPFDAVTTPEAIVASNPRVRRKLIAGGYFVEKLVQHEMCWTSR